VIEPRSSPGTARASNGSPDGGKLLLIARRAGRFGNRLVLFANFIALAKEHGHRVINPTFHSYANLFETTSQDIYCQYPFPARKSWFDVLPGVANAIRRTRIFYHPVRYAAALNTRVPLLGRKAITLLESREIVLMDEPAFQERIRDARIVFVYGWRYRAAQALQRHADAVRAYFRPVARHDTAARQAIERLRQKADVVIGVHVRQGDNWKWRGGIFHFKAPDYLVWMRQLVEQFPGRKVAFFICSDEPRNEAEFPGFTVGFGPDTPIGDMYALSHCDFIFGPPSTFTQWSSFYGNKPMIHVYDRADRLDLGKFKVSWLADIPAFR